jgi:membrane-associated protein
MCAAIVGDNTGYFLGRNAGPKIFNRPKSKFFNPEHLKRTHEFYEKYGARAVVYARFVPIVRTCTPFIAGVARMRYSRFLLFSICGGIFWITFMITLGYKLGQVQFVRSNFEKVVLTVIVLSLVPAFIEAWKARTRASETAQAR